MKKVKTISKEDLLKMDKGIHRAKLIDLGLYNIHKNKTFKSKKVYSRKNSKKIDF